MGAAYRVALILLLTAVLGYDSLNLAVIQHTYCTSYVPGISTASPFLRFSILSNLDCRKNIEFAADLIYNKKYR